MNNGENPTNLGVMIRKWRLFNERGLREVAKEIGINPSTLCRIENGKEFDVDTWLKLQNWLFKRNGEAGNEKAGSRDQGAERAS